MKSPQKEAQRWLAQAENDLQFAQLGLGEGFYAQTCFLAQQSAEKGLKALHYSQGARVVLGHSVWQLLQDLLAAYPKLSEFGDLAKELDQYYIPTRYPNGLPDGTPSEVYTQTQADQAVNEVKRLLGQIRTLCFSSGS